MKTRFFITACMAVCMSASAIDAVKIVATKKLDSKRESGSQKIGHGSTQLTQKNYFYRFDITLQSGTATRKGKAEWIIYMEDMSGRMRPADRGSKEIEMPFGRPVAVETEPVELNEREWSHKGSVGKIEDKLAGFAVRIFDSEGNQLGERCEPVSLRGKVDWKEEALTPGQIAEMRQKRLEKEKERLDKIPTPPVPPGRHGPPWKR